MVSILISQSLKFSQGCEDEDMGMQVLVNLRFSYASPSEDAGIFKVQASVTDTQNSTELEFELPPIKEIQDSYSCWKENYYNLVEGTNSEDFSTKGFKAGNKNIPSSKEECHKNVEILRNQVNQWLLPVKYELEKVIELESNSEIFFVVNTQNIESETIAETLHKIPWREWDYFPDCYALEAALCLNEAESNTPSVVDDGIFRRVRVTSIFGDVENIKEGVEGDKKEIEKLEKRGAELIHLEQPQLQDLKQLWDEPCDILFYSGHSNSDKNSTAGYFKINEDDNLSLEEVINTFHEAINKGLKIAIFNSCEGLGLAHELAKINLPYIIVWREPVPDKIAREFIEYFLSSYSQGKSLFDSVRDARIKLKEFTNTKGSTSQIPGLNWLPIICVNTKDEPPLWEDLGGLTGKLPDSPYQGLSAFGEEDAQYFFGREKFVAELLAAVNTKSLVPIVGASGSGKSSVVFAGLVPQLRESGMKIVSFRPGNNPFDGLAVALKSLPKETQVSSNSSRLEELELALNLEDNEKALCRFVEDLRNPTSQRFILIIDQFEELYTLTPEAQQQSFLNTLLYAVKHAANFCLILTLRADFYGHAISHREFSDALQQGIYNSSPMNEEELRAVIEQPAAKMKVELESGLADKLIDELGNQTGSLPLLEFTLSLLWEKHDKWYLTHQAYKEIGGLKQALAKYADGILNPLSAADKEKAERIFIQLISPGEGTEDTKRQATRGEVGEDNWGLVEFLANNRLVVTGWDESSQQETVEIVHEALIREWGMLREWIKRNREFRIWQERLKPDIQEWQNKKYDAQALLQGTRLAIALDWLKQRRDEITSLEQDFISASVKHRDKERNKQKRRRQLTICGLVGGLMLVSTFAGISEIR